MRSGLNAIYLDNAATTLMLPAVVAAMEPYRNDVYGNPASLHAFGRAARRALEMARGQVADLIGAGERDIVFVSGGTEANHAALVGAFLAANPALTANGWGGQADACPRRPHVVVSAIEHHAVLDTCAWLRQFGADVTMILPDKMGVVDAQAVVAAVRSDTCLVALMAVNNELGTIQPIEVVARLVKQSYPSVHVHSDMVQAPSALRLNLQATDIDSAAFSAHKLHGPQGIGALYLAPTARWAAVLRGGSQERNRRAGTPNLVGAVGFGQAAAELTRELESRLARVAQLRDDFWATLRDLPGISRNTPLTGIAPGILNLAFAGIRNETLLMRLDLEGVAASAGSACTAGSLEPSHVLKACGLTDRAILESVRFSLSELTSAAELSTATAIIRKVVFVLRDRAEPSSV